MHSETTVRVASRRRRVDELRVLRVVVGLVLAAVVAGCSSPPPVGVNRVGRRTVFRQVTRNALRDGVASAYSRTILDRHNLLERFDDDPVALLDELLAVVLDEPTKDHLFAMAELSYLTAQTLERKDLYLASACWAFAYLFGKESAGRHDPFDPRFRLASDIYNAGLADYLVDAEGNLQLTDGVQELPFGRVTIRKSTSGYQGFEFVDRLVPAMDFELRGIRFRNRQPGLGVSAIAVASTNAAEERPGRDPTIRANRPASVFLSLSGADLNEGRVEMQAELKVIDPRVTEEIEVLDTRVPIEADLSAPIAFGLQRSRIWDFEIRGLFSGEVEDFPPGTYLLQPYSPGKIPVVFVHGTASGPARWADAFNSLETYPTLRKKFQYWFFLYPTGNFIPYSAGLLRDSLHQLVERLDPEGRDPALRRMVLVAHSQGGLLARFQVTDPGETFWNAALEQGVDPDSLSSENRELLRKLLVFERSSEVSRVVFLATPHGGSFLAARWYSKLGARMINAPSRISDIGKEIFSKDQSLERQLGGRVPTSLDNMDPSSLFIKTIGFVPVSSEVKAHSIIAVLGDGPVEEGNDGVVEYKAAHIDGVESEFVVPSGHSCQSHPLTIRELRRILLEHLSEFESRNEPTDLRSEMDGIQ